MPHPEPLITLDNITVRVGGQWLLQGLSWQIKSNENWIVWGPNGAGKTTLVKAILGQLAVVRGRIHRHYTKTVGHGPHPHARYMASISSEQQAHLCLREALLDEMAHFSGKPDLATTPGKILSAVAGSSRDHLHRVIRQLGLGPIIAKPLKVLSAGEMRKLLICRALIAKPRLLILDEPYNALDTEFRDRLSEILNQLAADGIQMILITHRPKEIPAAFTHLLHLDRGEVKWQGPVQNFFKKKAEKNSEAPLEDPATVWETRLPAITHGGTQESAPLIQMRNISVTYGPHKVLSRVYWTVRSGENWALIGPNGAGKSTLLRLIIGDNLQGYANDLMLFGRRKGSGESIWEIKQQIGYMSDDIQLRYQKKMSSFDVVCSGFFDSIGLYRHCSREQKQAARMWLSKTGMEALSQQLFSKLSFGQQRLVLIVRAAVKSPRLLILDEPCNGLDPVNRKGVLEILDLIGRSGTTNLLYVSHRPEEIPNCITHRLHIAAGRVVGEPYSCRKKIETLVNIG